MTQKELVLPVTGMVCGGCESAIENALEQLEGVSEVHASHSENRVLMQIEPDRVSTAVIIATIRNAGYEVPETPLPLNELKEKKAVSPVQARQMDTRIRNVLLFLALLVIIGGIVQWGRSLMPGVMMQINSGVSYAALLLIGFLTGFHCIGMCGSFVVNYARRTTGLGQAALAHAAYGSGKTLSYAAIGALFGAAGALVAITPIIRGWAALAAGLFLVLFGLKMLHLIPELRLLSLRCPKTMTKQVMTSLSHPRAPFITGLLNGLLLGCGPLQAMYIMAAGTGEPLTGALMLASFGLGTLPPLIGFGFFASYLSQESIQQLIRVSAVLVMFMGLMMLNRGYTLLSSAPAMMGG